MLTKEANKLFCTIYQSFAASRKSGKSREESCYFAGSRYLHETFFPNWNFDDVDDCCRELSKAGLIQCNWCNNSAQEIFITDLGIRIMQNQFNDNLEKIGQAIVKGIEILL